MPRAQVFDSMPMEKPNAWSAGPAIMEMDTNSPGVISPRWASQAA